MLCDRLMELRAEEALDQTRPNEDFSKFFAGKNIKRRYNPFNDKKRNPFLGKENPFT